MFFPLFFSYAFLLLCSSSLSSGNDSGNETDRLALLQFKAKITEDPFGALTSWNNTIHFCSWQGVTCSQRHQRVTKLVLPQKKLQGTISPYFGNLSFLRELDLGDNFFHQHIPPEIGRLRRLQLLVFANNTLSGEIPSNISSCSNLEMIFLGNNNLEGRIPTEIGSLSRLQLLSFQRNKITGSIPSSFGNLSSLTQLYMPSNYISGNIPDTIGNLKNLLDISLGINNLTGNIPPALFNLSLVRILGVAENNLEGTLPWNLGNIFPNLQVLDLRSNHFRGSVPFTLSNSSNLWYYSISYNQFLGQVPSLKKLHNLVIFDLRNNFLDSDSSFLCSLTNATNLYSIDIQVNLFRGELPRCMGNLSNNLQTLIVGSNKFYGSIPSELGNLVSLEVLALYNNSLTGEIPSSIGNLYNVKKLLLWSNLLSGSLPSFLGNLKEVIEIHLYDNNFEGQIPPSIGKCQRLLVLNLFKNNLRGPIPKELMSITSLGELSIRENHLDGSIPGEIGNLRTLRILDVSSNSLRGNITNALGSCTSLEYLYMDKNYLEGSIPHSLHSLRAIQVLNLSHNNLSGKIPDFLEGWNGLQYLDISYNNFEGEVPIGGVFRNTSAAFVIGNERLCGGIPEFGLPSCRVDKPKRNLVKLISGILCGAIGFALVVFLSLCWIRKKGKEYVSNDTEELLPRVSYQDLHNATNGFSPANLIGKGSFGSMYKATLNQCEDLAAVKVFDPAHCGSLRSFAAECKALKTVRHRNLLKVITVCSGIDYQGNDFHALVYEFMVNGSLDDWLHPCYAMENASGEGRKLFFSQRLNIALDVACALDYLHNNCDPPIAHCDLKPSNVLLDVEMTGHVGDFGLAKLLPTAAQDTSISQSSSFGVRGTVGYAAPEYGMGSEISTKGDVYSFGVLLLEMFTGKRPTDNMFHEDFSLHKFVKIALPERILEILDPIRLEEVDLTENDDRKNGYQDCMLECLISIFEVGIKCTMELPSKRMNISDIVTELQLMKQELIRFGRHK